jgi:putative hydrolase of the HAD superfamily
VLKAIFFDVDDTLYSTTEFATRARSNSLDSLARMGLSVKKEELGRELDEVIREFSSNYEHHFDQLLLRLPEKVLAGLNPALLTAAAVVAYHDTKFNELVAYEDVTDVLKLLAQTDLLLGVITDGPVIKQAEKIIRLGILPYLDQRAIFITHQMGYSKPNVKLYLRVCHDLYLEPAEVMYVGDNPVNDIDPPNRAGMITVRSRRKGKYHDVSSETEPRHEIHNFWDLLELLQTEHGLDVPADGVSGS